MNQLLGGKAPLDIFREWFAQHQRLYRGISAENVNAMCLSTCTAHGRPSSRMVLLKEVAVDGFVFYTNYEGKYWASVGIRINFIFYSAPLSRHSFLMHLCGDHEGRKGGELKENPYASLLFWWEEERQVRVEGSVERLTEEQSDAYFASRSRLSQVGAHASKQSSVLQGGYDELRQNYEKECKRFESVESIPRPPWWGGFRLLPTAMEFWQNGEHRLHQRIRYEKAVDGGWSSHFLNP